LGLQNNPTGKREPVMVETKQRRNAVGPAKAKITADSGRGRKSIYVRIKGDWATKTRKEVRWDCCRKKKKKKGKANAFGKELQSRARRVRCPKNLGFVKKKKTGQGVTKREIVCEALGEKKKNAQPANKGTATNAPEGRLRRGTGGWCLTKEDDGRISVEEPARKKRSNERPRG